MTKSKSSTSATLLTAAELANLRANPEVLMVMFQSDPQDEQLRGLMSEMLAAKQPVPTKGDAVETTKVAVKENTGEFVDFKGGNEYSLEITDSNGVAVVELLFNQINTWNTVRKPGEPATSPDKSYILLKVGKILGKDEFGNNKVKQAKKYLLGKGVSGYMFMKKNLKLDEVASVNQDKA